MRYRYYYFDRRKNEVAEFLNDNKIKYDVIDYGGDDVWLRFSIYSSMANADYCTEELKKMNRKAIDVFAEYTAKEYSEAKLLWMYPYNFFVDVLNVEESIRYACSWMSRSGWEVGNHPEQICDYVIHKVPSTKKTVAFHTNDTGSSDLYADYRIKQLVEEYQLKGFKFRNVYLKNGVCCDDFFQVEAPCIIKEECMEFGYGEKVHRCPVCDRKHYYLGNAIQLHLDLSKIEEESDLYITEGIFGDGHPGPYYIISQKLYRLLKEKKLAGKLTFRPIADVSK